MNILLIAANTRAQAEPSLGIGYLASYLRRYHQNSEINIKLMNYFPNDLTKIKEFSPDLVGLSVLTNKYQNAVAFAKKIKTGLDVPIILGGHHISIAPSSFDPIFDIGVMGEGEQTFLELIQCFEKYGLDKKILKTIPGLLYRENGTLVTTPERPLIEPLDRIPLPARDLFNMDFMLGLNKNVFGQSFGRGTHMFTSRGCPFHCYFCSASSFWRQMRYNSSDYVLAEIHHLQATYNVKLLHIYDDLFLANKKRLRTIVQRIVSDGLNKQIDFGMFGRADIFDMEIAKLLSEMNTVFIEFGIESGTQRILDILKGGKVKIEQIRNAVSLCKQFGIKVGGTFIIGTPGETEDEMLQTLEFVKSLHLDKFSFFTLNPYPGTPLWDDATKDHLLPDDLNWDTFEMKKTRKITENDILQNTGQILIDKNISPKRFAEIFSMFEDERQKLYNYKWEEEVPPEETPSL